MKFWVLNSADIQILATIFIDILIGDPHQLPHIVIYYGKILKALESRLNRGSFRILKGFLGVCILLTTVSAFSYTLYVLAPHLKASTLILSTWLMSSCLAMKSLSDHALKVYNELKKNNMDKARLYTSYIVGRDTQSLNEAELTRAVVETVAENTVDGVTAPMFYILCFGLPGGLIYKAINTLDSMWGHRNNRYEKFGKVAARLDDIANFIPARLTAITVIIASSLLPKLSGKNAVRIMLRDRYKHPSPNSGISESSFAGALGIKLGGTNYYNGVVSNRGVLGDGNKDLCMNHIQQSIGLMQASSLLFAILGMAIRVVIR